MSNIDVEALLDSAADATTRGHDEEEDIHRADRNGRRDRDRHRDGSRDRKRRDRSADRDRRDDDLRSPRSDTRRDRDRDRDRDRRRNRDSAERDDRGGYYRGGRTRSRSADRDGDSYRPNGRREDRDSRSDARKRSRSPRRDKTPTPPPTEDERDRRTVFVQQLAARLRSKDLIAFFEKVGPVKEAQIVKDRVTGRSKGVGYVEFKDESSVPLAIQLTGQKVLGIPIIAQLTEAEKNRQARTAAEPSQAAGSTTQQAPFHRLYVGNIHFSITEGDLQNVFEPFGELEFVQLQKEDTGRSRGYGFVQFRDPNQAREALEKMNGFDLAGRPIRVGLGNDKFTPESTANLLQRFQGGNERGYQGSEFSGRGGRGSHAGGSGQFDRAGGKDEKSGGASALDDADVSGVNFNNFSRDSLMRKLARNDESPERNGNGRDRSRERDRDRDHDRRDRDRDDRGRPDRDRHDRDYRDRDRERERDSEREKDRYARDRRPPRGRGEGRGAASAMMSMASRCILLKNMFDPAEEDSDTWIRELEDDVKAECEEKYGKVVHISLDESSQGDIYLKFSDVKGGENAIRGLNGRFFGGRQISATPVVDAVYSSLFSKTRNL